MLSVTTAPAALAVTLTTVKDHLHVTDSTEDTIITAYLNAAINWVEDYLRRPLINRAMKLTLDAFPSGTQIEIPMPTVSAIASVQYYNTAGVLTTFSSDDYWTVLNEVNGPGLIVLKETKQWPEVQSSRPRVVEIAFTCGYGSADTNIPAEIKQAILLLTGHLYTNRLPIVTGTIATPIGFTVEAMLGARRFYTLG